MRSLISYNVGLHHCYQDLFPKQMIKTTTNNLIGLRAVTKWYGYAAAALIAKAISDVLAGIKMLCPYRATDCDTIQLFERSNQITQTGKIMS